jgi:hypothetical protein
MIHSHHHIAMYFTYHFTLEGVRCCDVTWIHMMFTSPHISHWMVLFVFVITTLTSSHSIWNPTPWSLSMIFICFICCRCDVTTWILTRGGVRYCTLHFISRWAMKCASNYVDNPTPCSVYVLTYIFTRGGVRYCPLHFISLYGFSPTGRWRRACNYVHNPTSCHTAW